MNTEIFKPNQLTFRETEYKNTLWEEVSLSVPGTTVINPKEITEHTVNGIFTFCPLYAPGSLENSQLLSAPKSIQESRVAGKWTAIQKVVDAMQNNLNSKHIGLDLTVVFANKGVLLGNEPSSADIQSLKDHEYLYRETVDKMFRAKGLKYKFKTFDDYNVQFPKFVNPRSSIPDNETMIEGQSIELSESSYILNALNIMAEKQNIPTRLTQNKTTRKKISELIKAFGPNTAYWLTAGYLVFDYNIPEIVGCNGVYLSTERFAPLFRIASLTPGVKNMTRVEIPA